MTTKERIADEALSLFSIKGYNGTSVKNIADAVGIKDSSIYKHFKSKQEILDTIMDKMKESIYNMSKGFGIPDEADYSKAANYYKDFSEENLVDLSKNVFLFYLEDSLLSRFWRMGVIEQYKNESVYMLYRKFFLEDSIQYQTKLFAEMVNQKIFINIDPHVMAMSFYTPIFFLLSKYSGISDKRSEAVEILEKQVREFYRVYRI